MRLVFDPVRHHFMKSITPAEKYVESAVEASLEPAVDLFNFAADTRLGTQRIMYDALTYRTKSVRRWITHGDTDPSLEEIVMFGAIVGISTILTVSPYLGPWAVVSAPLAAAVDIRNLYNYYS